MSIVRIGHLYPAEMNIYGDYGNIIALRKRLEWRGYEVQVLPIESGTDVEPSNIDIIFGGGGQDSGQLRIGADLRQRGEYLRAAVADGMPLLVVCGLYQLLGHGFVIESGKEIEGVSVFDTTTRASTKRMIGNIVVDSAFGELVGFENHSGQTVLGKNQQPLGKVKKGWGNNDSSHYEGSITNNAIGTYLHGPILPKNPRLTDHLILTALKRRHLADELPDLDDALELKAAAAAAKRPQ